MKIENIDVKEIAYATEFVRIKKLQATEELASNIAKVGLLNPIVVIPAKKGYVCLAGNRRLYAVSKILKQKTIACQVLPTSADNFAVALSENLERENLEPLEVGKWVTVATVREMEKLPEDKRKNAAKEIGQRVAMRLGLSENRVRELARTWQRATPKQRQAVMEKKQSADSLRKTQEKQAKPKPKSKASLIKSTQKRIVSMILGKGNKDINSLYNRLIFVNKHLDKICVSEDALRAIERLCMICDKINSQIKSFSKE